MFALIGIWIWPVTIGCVFAVIAVAARINNGWVARTREARLRLAAQRDVAESSRERIAG